MAAHHSSYPPHVATADVTRQQMCSDRLWSVRTPRLAPSQDPLSPHAWRRGNALKSIQNHDQRARHGLLVSPSNDGGVCSKSTPPPVWVTRIILRAGSVQNEVSPGRDSAGPPTIQAGGHKGTSLTAARPPCAFRRTSSRTPRTLADPESPSRSTSLSAGLRTTPPSWL